MTLGEKIKACRQRAGMSQEKVAELVGVSRQAVTKWEVNQSVPTTENLFKLAGIFGTTVYQLLGSEAEVTHPSVEPADRPRSGEEETILPEQPWNKKVRIALLFALGYLSIYLLGRILWCDRSGSNLVGWLCTVRPSGEHSYLYGWLLSSRLFWCAAAVTVLPALFGKRRFSCAAFLGFVTGFLAGILFGPYPEGAAMGHGHYGWAIWGVVFLLSMVAGIVLERKKKRMKHTSVEKRQ